MAKLSRLITSYRAAFFYRFLVNFRGIPLENVNETFPTKLKWTKVKIFHLKVTASPGREKLAWAHKIQFIWAD